MKRRTSLAIGAIALTTLTLPWSVVAVSTDCPVDESTPDACAILAPYAWDGRLAGDYAAPDYVWDGRLAGSRSSTTPEHGAQEDSPTAPDYVWDGRLAG